MANELETMLQTLDLTLSFLERNEKMVPEQEIKDILSDLEQLSHFIGEKMHNPPPRITDAWQAAADLRQWQRTLEAFPIETESAPSSSQTGGKASAAFEQTKKIFPVVGYYGAGNFGDELLLDALLFKLREIPDSFPVAMGIFEAEKDGYSRKHHVTCVNLLDAALLEKADKLAEKCQALFVGPGGLLQELAGPAGFYKPDGSYVYLLPSVLAQLYGKPVFGVGIGCDAHCTSETLRGFGFAMRGFSKIYVRDENSKKVLQEKAGLQNSKLSADFAFLYPFPEPKKKTKKDKWLGISLRTFPKIDHENMASQVGGILANFLTKGWNVRILILQEEQAGGEMMLAEQMTQAIEAAGMKGRFQVVKPETVKETVEAIQTFDLYICMRLHGCIAAAMMGVPFLALAYHEKITETMKRLQLEEFTFDVSTFKAKEAYKKADWILSHRDIYLERVRRKCAEQKQIAQEDWEEIQAFLKNRNR